MQKRMKNTLKSLLTTTRLESRKGLIQPTMHEETNHNSWQREEPRNIIFMSETELTGKERHNNRGGGGGGGGIYKIPVTTLLSSLWHGTKRPYISSFSEPHKQSRNNKIELMQ